jgi:hypothetical protein
LPQLRRLVVDLLAARRYGSIKRLNTTVRINLERYNARIKRQESGIARFHIFGGSPFVFSGQANVADAVVKSATLTTRPILHIIRSRGFGHGRNLIVATESFDQIGHNHARWGTWAQLEDVYYKTLPNYPNCCRACPSIPRSSCGQEHTMIVSGLSRVIFQSSKG